MAAATLVAPRRPVPRVRSRHALPAAPRRHHEPSVLVADTHEDSRTVCAMLLRHAGVHVLEADTGEEVIRLAHAARPRAIVMATTLRGVEGIRALEVLKDHPATARIPVIVTSSVCGDDQERRARAAGCAAYLLKPCPPRRVLEVVETVAGTFAR